MPGIRQAVASMWTLYVKNRVNCIQSLFPLPRAFWGHGRHWRTCRQGALAILYTCWNGAHGMQTASPLSQHCHRDHCAPRSHVPLICSIYLFWLIPQRSVASPWTTFWTTYGKNRVSFSHQCIWLGGWQKHRHCGWKKKKSSFYKKKTKAVTLSLLMQPPKRRNQAGQPDIIYPCKLYMCVCDMMHKHFNPLSFSPCILLFSFIINLTYRKVCYLLSDI